MTNVNSSLKGLRILIVEDSLAGPQGLKGILQKEYPQAIFGHASSAPGGLESARKESWDLVVLGLMPSWKILDALKEMRTHSRALPVVVWGALSEEQMAVRALKSGASSYVSKDKNGHGLIEGVAAALGGEKHTTAPIAIRLAESLVRSAAGPRHAALSNREFQVFCLLAARKTVKETHTELRLSMKTVSTYRSRVLKKMKLKNNAELMEYAVQNGLIQDEG